MRPNLFDGADSNDDDDVSKIEVDADYARRYEHNKKREDLQRFEDLRKKGVVDDPSPSEPGDESSSSSDGEFDGANWDGPNKKDVEFFNALIKVRNQDPSLKQKGVSLFESDDEEGDGGVVKKGKNSKIYLKDVVAKQLIEEGPDFDDENAERGEGNRKKSYSEEQEEMRRAFLEAAGAAHDGGDDTDFLREKKRDDGYHDDEGDVAEFQEKLDEYFGGKEELDENGVFLKEFFLNKMWIDKDGKKEIVVDDEELDQLEDDEEEIWKQEDFENSFRHEEDLGDRIWGHSRNVEGSVRKVENTRKKQRKSKEERLKIAELEREEELKHLKNLKREEMREKLRKFKQIAGIGDEEECQFDVGELADDFDPDEYDQMMKQVFDDKYYNTEDVDPDFGSDKDEGDGDFEKPDFEKEDELLGLPKGWDVSGSGDAFLAARERSLKHKTENTDDDGDYNEDWADEELCMENVDDTSLDDRKRKRKRKLSLVKRAKEAMLEEFYKLDYEDTIGDLKTRFKYAKIKPNRYGLSAEEILMMDDKELNQYVSLKKLAPYREQEWKVNRSKRYQIKVKEGALEEVTLKKDKPKKRGDDNQLPTTSALENGKQVGNGSSEDQKKLSKKAKRRLRQAAFKLSESRLKAYGKIAPKSKEKKDQ